VPVTDRVHFMISKDLALQI